MRHLGTAVADIGVLGVGDSTSRSRWHLRLLREP